jgi:MarR family transcriptional regulator, organic hydroperoxide resistance regulator
MDERLLEYLAVMRDFGRIYTQRILEGSRESSNLLKISRIKALYAFRDQDSSTMSELAENIGAKLPSMTMMIDNLADEGLVERARDEQDRRKVIVRLTDKGQRVREEFLQQRKQIAEQLFARLSREDEQELMSALSRVCDILEKAFFDELDA